VEGFLAVLLGHPTILALLTILRFLPCLYCLKFSSGAVIEEIHVLVGNEHLQLALVKKMWACLVGTFVNMAARRVVLVGDSFAVERVRKIVVVVAAQTDTMSAEQLYYMLSFLIAVVAISPALTSFHLVFDHFLKLVLLGSRILLVLAKILAH
jgi:hypothetical protein